MHGIGDELLQLVCAALGNDDASCFAQTSVASRDAVFFCFPRRVMIVRSEDTQWTNICRIAVHDKRFSLNVTEHVMSVARLVWAQANGAPLNDYHLGELAARAGHLDVLQHAHALRPRELDQATSEAAASTGQLPIVIWLHNSGCPLDDHRALCEAASGGHVHVLEWILTHRVQADAARRPSPDDCCKVACAAASAGHVEVLEWIRDKLLPLQPDFDSSSVDPWATDAVGMGNDAYEHAAKGGQLVALQWLTHESTHDWLVHGGEPRLVQAAEGSLPVLKFMWEAMERFNAYLLSEPPGPSLCHKEWKGLWRDIWSAAARRGDEEMIDWAEHNGPCMATSRKVFMAACDSGSLEFVQWLHGKLEGRIPDGEFYSSAMETAARDGHLPLLRWLRSVAPGNAWPASRAMGIAIGMGGRCADRTHNERLAVLKWVAENKLAMDSDFVYACSQYAATAGNLPMLQHLLSCKVDEPDPRYTPDDFPPWIRCYAETAAREGHVYILEWLVAQPWGERIDWHEAARFAAKRGRLYVLEWMHAKHRRVDWRQLKTHVVGEHEDEVMSERIRGWLAGLHVR